MKKITFDSVLKDGLAMGIKNFPSLLLVAVLYVVTIWIPYLNVGTTIAVYNIPLELSKGNIINPLFIFDSRFRRQMPEFFTLIGIKGIAQCLAYLFLWIPGVILSLAWSMAVYLMFDKKIDPTEALVKSNEITYGYKVTLFLVGLCIGLAMGIIMAVCYAINDTFGNIITIILCLLAAPVMWGCNAAAYKGLTSEGETPDETVCLEEASVKEA